MYRNPRGLLKWTTLCLLGLVVLAGCQIPQQAASRRNVWRPVAPVDAARLNLFLVLDEQLGPAIQLEVSSVEVLARDIWLPLRDEPVLLDSLKIGGAQLFLGGQTLGPGHYERLRLTVARGSLLQPDGRYAVLISEPVQLELPLQGGVGLKEGASKTVLIKWNVNGSLEPDNTLSPKMVAYPALRQLPTSMVLVTCPEINTVFIVRTDNNWVVDSFGLPGGPSYLAVEPSLNRQRLYVLTPHERALKVIDLSSQRVVESFPTLNEAVTHMATSPDGQWAYLLNEESGYVSRMNLTNGQIDGRILLGSRPNYLVYLEQQRLLAVSLGLAQQVVLLDPETLNVFRRISTGSSPEGMLVLDNRLYVAESGDASVLVSDLANVNDRSNVMVGFKPRRLADADGQVFVSNYSDGSLSVLLPGQSGVVQEIYGLGRPLEMVFDPLYRRLYVADDRDASVAVFDVTSNQLLGQISLGAKALGMAVMQ